MWWPRPRWKSDFFTRFVLLVSVTIATTTDAVMADEGQLCGGSDMSVVIWTTALCTMLLVLIVVVIYFVYCKRREHDWSSLWWKSNSDKNIVLQTSPPTKGQQEKIGGTDNPAFVADSYVGDRVTKTTGSTKIVHVPILDDGSLGAELSIKEEYGRKIYMCQQNEGSIDRLVAMRLVFDKGGPLQQRQLCGSSSDLSRAIVELSCEYGLRVELETEGDATITSGAAVACENSDGLEKCSVKSNNLLSVVRGTAQRLWQQRPAVFKNDDDSVDADKKTVDDVESGRVAFVATDSIAAVDPAKSPCSAVTMVDETATQLTAVQQPVQSARYRSNNEPVQYRTLEYGAALPSADAVTRLSPDSSIQYCTVNPSEPVMTTTVTQAVEINDTTAVTIKDTTIAVQMSAITDDIAADEVQAPNVDDGDEAKPVKTDQEEPAKYAAAANPPPPPPPRKYSTSTVQVSSIPATVTVPRATVAANTSTAVTADTSTVESQPMTTATTAVQEPKPPLPTVVNSLAPANTMAPNEIRIDDDYYWCTTTAMAAPMSTFGKQLKPSTTAAAGRNSKADDTGVHSSAVQEAITLSDMDAVCIPVADEKSAAAVFPVDDKNGEVAIGQDLVALSNGDGGRNLVAGGTTSIEDASLPSFSSDEDVDDDEEDDVDDRGGETKLSCSSAVPVTTKDAVTVNPSGDGEVALAVDGGHKVGSHKSNVKADFNDSIAAAATPAATPSAVVDPKTPTKLPTLRPSLSSPLSSNATTSCCSSSSASSTSSTSSSPTNNGSNNNNSPIVSKIPVRRQSAGSISSNGGTTVSMSLTNNNSAAKKGIPLPLSRSGSRLAMWSSVN